eukprot:Rmarinus@m.5537
MWKRLLCTTAGPIEQRIRQKLMEELVPSHLVIMNESYMHNVPKGSETHFKIVIASTRFEAMTPVRRHQLLYDVLADERRDGVHALSLKTLTPTQWDAIGEEEKTMKSPQCLGGSRR